MIQMAVFCNTGLRRAELLATKFTQEGIRFFRWQNNEWEEWDDNEQDWNYAQPEQQHVRILFRHTGDLDLDAHQPPNAHYNYCVNFSTAGVRSEDGSFGIPERFPTPENNTIDTCPLSDSDIQEFIHWANNQRGSPPDICFGRKTAEIRAALYILCDAYLRSEAEERPLPCDPKWWQNALCQQRPPADNLPRAVNRLLDEIFNEIPPNEIDSNNVREAYKALQ